MAWRFRRARRAAILLDYDNVHTGPMRTDPTLLTAWLERGRTDGPRLRFLDRRAYWNREPDHGEHESVAALDAAGFAYRSTFCFVAGKGASDVCIAFDCRGLLDRRPALHHVVLVSSDSSFKPLVDEIRSAARAITVIYQPEKTNSRYVEFLGEEGLPLALALEEAARWRADRDLRSWRARLARLKRALARPFARQSTLTPSPAQRVPAGDAQAGRAPRPALPALGAAVIGHMQEQGFQYLSRKPFRVFLTRFDGFHDSARAGAWFGYRTADGLMRAVADHCESLTFQVWQDKGQLVLNSSYAGNQPDRAAPSAPSPSDDKSDENKSGPSAQPPQPKRRAERADPDEKNTALRPPATS